MWGLHLFSVIGSGRWTGVGKQDKGTAGSDMQNRKKVEEVREAAGENISENEETEVIEVMTMIKDSQADVKDMNIIEMKTKELELELGIEIPNPEPISEPALLRDYKTIPELGLDVELYEDGEDMIEVNMNTDEQLGIDISPP